MNKVISMLLCLTLLLGLAGCGTEKVNQASDQPSQQFEQSSSVIATPETAESAVESNTETTEDDTFDVADEIGETQDFSKYEEVQKKVPSTSSGDGQREPVEPGDVPIDRNNQKTCYLSISCATILNNMENLVEGKDVLVPSDGIILPRTEVTFYEGESVFDVLQRETKNRRIHMESSFTPMYNSAYIEGIGNLYEFDCGSESGWEYRVNGWFPNYGVSRYVVQQGDEVEFLYTCNLGVDLGSNVMN